MRFCRFSAPYYKRTKMPLASGLQAPHYNNWSTINKHPPMIHTFFLFAFAVPGGNDGLCILQRKASGRPIREYIIHALDWVCMPKRHRFAQLTQKATEKKTNSFSGVSYILLSRLTVTCLPKPFFISKNLCTMGEHHIPVFASSRSHPDFFSTTLFQSDS